MNTFYKYIYSFSLIYLSLCSFMKGCHFQSAIYFSLGPVDREWCAFSGWYGTISGEI